MNATKLKKISLPSNSDFSEASKLEDLVNQVKAKGDFLEKVFGALVPIHHPHINMSDHIMIALQDPEIYHALNFLFETPLHHYQCYNNAFHYLPFDEMCGHRDTPLADVVRVFSEIKDSLLAAHLNSVNVIS